MRKIISNQEIVKTKFQHILQWGMSKETCGSHVSSLKHRLSKGENLMIHFLARSFRLRNNLRLLAESGLTLLLLGCNSVPNSGYGGMGPMHPNDYIYGTKTDEVQQHINHIANGISSEEALYYAATDDASRVLHRNNIISMLRTPIDEFYRRYASAFYGNNAYLQTTLESTTGTLSGAAAITSPPAAKSILAALSTAVGGFATSYEKNVLQQQTTTAVLHQMEADVALYGQVISQGLAKTDHDYPLAQAYADIQTYSRSMTVPHALSSMSAAAGAQLSAVKDQVAKGVSVQADKNQSDTKPQGMSAPAPTLVPPGK